MTKKMMMSAAAFGLAMSACDGDPTGNQGVTTDEVAGIYAVCSLSFDPNGDLLRTVDIIEAGFETENPDVRAPQLQADANGDFQLLFTPSGQFVERSLLGSLTTSGTNRVVMSFTGGTASASAYLLPNRLEVSFQETPKSLTTAQTLEYDVPRADYARLADSDESGLAELIPGRLQVVFQSIGTGCG